jgi:hypothetical protein
MPVDCQAGLISELPIHSLNNILRDTHTRIRILSSKIHPGIAFLEPQDYRDWITLHHRYHEVPSLMVYVSTAFPEETTKELLEGVIHRSGLATVEKSEDGQYLISTKSPILSHPFSTKLRLKIKLRPVPSPHPEIPDALQQDGQWQQLWELQLFKEVQTSWVLLQEASLAFLAPENETQL